MNQDDGGQGNGRCRCGGTDLKQIPFQAVNNQNGDDGRRQFVSNIFYKDRHSLFTTKDQEWKGTQQNCNEQCGQQKIVRAEDEQAQSTGYEAGGSRQLCLSGIAKYLFHENDNKKGCHGKINARKVKGKYLAEQCADDRAGNPVALIQQ